MKTSPRVEPDFRCKFHQCGRSRLVSRLMPVGFFDPASITCTSCGAPVTREQTVANSIVPPDFHSGPISKRMLIGLRRRLLREEFEELDAELENFSASASAGKISRSRT